MEKLRRKDSFFGLHFDFHANPNTFKGVIGENLTEKDIRKICREIKPDFIQIDCKGHPGYTSYPTKLGNAMPKFAKDTLALWRKVTDEEGVALYMHYSGIRDLRYIRTVHPDEAAMRIDGSYMDEDICPFRSNYLEELMIPQLLELGEYGCDGVWVDGDCWGVKVGYHPDVIKQFEDEYEVSISENPPQKYGDPYYEEYREFHREGFRRYLKKYCDAVHEKYPNFQIASNWAYSEEMPEAVNTPVDFLSGDFAPSNSVESVQFSARILAAQDMPWDLMSWSFRCTDNNRCNKTPEQLKQEASAIMMLGGSYQCYIPQLRDGTPRLNAALNMKPLADYCRRLQPFCKDIKNIPQVTIYNSTVDHYTDCPYPFSNGTLYNSIQGLTLLLSRAGMSFDIREEHNLFDTIDNFPVVFVPEVNNHFGANDTEVLSKYAENGGTLVLSGVKTLAAFKKRLNLTLGEIGGPITTISTGDGFWSQLESNYCEVSGDEILAFATKVPNDEVNRFPVAAAKRVGNGIVILIGTDLGSASKIGLTVTARKLVEKVFDFYSPIARVDGTRFCNINISKKNEKMLIHLLNTSGEHKSSSIYNSDEILDIHNLTLHLSSVIKPKHIKWQPDGVPLKFEKVSDGYDIKLPPLHIHAVVEIEI